MMVRRYASLGGAAVAAIAAIALGTASAAPASAQSPVDAVRTAVWQDDVAWAKGDGSVCSYWTAAGQSRFVAEARQMWRYFNKGSSAKRAVHALRDCPAAARWDYKVSASAQTPLSKVRSQDNSATVTITGRTATAAIPDWGTIRLVKSSHGRWLVDWGA